MAPAVASGLEEPRIVERGTAAKNAGDGWTVTIFGISIIRRLGITPRVGVLAPLPHVAMHVVQAEGIGRKLTDCSCSLPVLALHSVAIRVVAIVVGLRGGNRIADRKCSLRVGAAGVLPPGLGQQPMGRGGCLRKTLRIRFRLKRPLRRINCLTSDVS